MNAGCYIDGVLTPSATPALIRQAVAHGAKVVVDDGTGIQVEIDKATIARIDRRARYYHKPCTTSTRPTSRPS